MIFCESLDPVIPKATYFFGFNGLKSTLLFLAEISRLDFYHLQTGKVKKK